MKRKRNTGDISGTSDLEALGILACGTAHDFNNILAIISGYAEMLREDLPEGSPSSEKAQGILNAVSRGRSLTEQILMFSRQGEIKKETTNIALILRESIDFAKTGSPKGITIKTRINRENVLVFADPTQLFRMFLNIIVNSFQAMEEKGGKLLVTLSVVSGIRMKKTVKKPSADEYVLISFGDTGPGISEEVKERISEPFFTARKSGKGTGLGLSIVHGIVSDIGGEIFVSGKKMHGTVFRILLPVVNNEPTSGDKNLVQLNQE